MAVEQSFGDTLPLTFPPYYDQSVSSLPNLADVETPPTYESLWSEPRERYRIIIFRLKSSIDGLKQKTRKILIGRTQFVVYGAFVVNCIIFAVCFGLMAPKLGHSVNWFTEDNQPLAENKQCEDSLQRVADTLQWVCFVHAFCGFCASLFSIAQYIKACVGRPYSALIFLASITCLFTGAFIIFFFFVSWEDCGTGTAIFLEQSLQLELIIFLMLSLGTNAVYVLIAVLFSVLPEYVGEQSDSSSPSRRSPPNINISSIYDAGLSTARRGPQTAIEERVADAQRVNDMSIYIERCQINPPPPYQEHQ
uniref:Uncharacterized protein n=1 Tax=Plectus sambesii TaxID=2011161 RepID=A0A914VJF0_9BILA